MNSMDNSPAGTKQGFFYGWYVMAASWIMLFLVYSVAVSIFFKPILDEFGWDRATLSSVQTVAMLVFAVVSPFMGRLIDRFGPRAMLFVCVATQTLSSLITGLATSLWHLYISRFLFEIRVLHNTQVLINRWFVRKRGRALGIVATGPPAGALVLSPISQYLILTWGWRDTMLFWAGVIFVVLLVLTILIRDNPQDKGYGPDGESLPAPATVADSPGREINSQTGQTAATGITVAAAVRQRSFWLLAAAHLICGIGCGFMMTHIVIFATDVGYSAMIGASFVSVCGAVNLVGVLVTGYMSDRYARKKVLSLTHAIRCVSFLVVVGYILLDNGGLWLLYLAMALFGFSWFTTAPLASGLVADLFGQHRMGTILGMILSCHIIGMAVGAYAGGITFELTDSYFLVFLCQGILEFLAAAFAFMIKQPISKNHM